MVDFLRRCRRPVLVGLLVGLVAAGAVPAAQAQVGRAATLPPVVGSAPAGPATPALPVPAAPAAPRPPRLLPLFGGLTLPEAGRLVGAARLDAIAASFASREEASAFLSTKGYEYLAEGQPDTAVYRLNLAWLLDPRNPAVYRGLGVVASSGPDASLAVRLLVQGLALAPTDALMLADLGSAHLLRFQQAHKKKDLAAGLAFLQRATATDPANAVAWQQLARAYSLGQQYPLAWQALHKSRALSMATLDYDLVAELLAHQPDPQGLFK